MSNQIYPVLKGLLFPIEREDIWDTLKIQRSSGGVVKTMISQLYPSYTIFRLKYNMIDLNTYTDQKIMRSFFNSVRGGFDDFLFEDINNNYLDNEYVGTGDGLTKEFQIKINYGTYKCPIYGKPKGTLKVYIDDVETEDFTVNNYGKIIFDNAIGDNLDIKVKGYIYHRVRFNQTKISLSEFLYRWYEGDIELSTFKPGV